MTDRTPWSQFDDENIKVPETQALVVKRDEVDHLLRDGIASKGDLMKRIIAGFQAAERSAFLFGAPPRFQGADFGRGPSETVLTVVDVKTGQRATVPLAVVLEALTRLGAISDPAAQAAKLRGVLKNLDVIEAANKALVAENEALRTIRLRLVQPDLAEELRVAKAQNETLRKALEAVQIKLDVIGSLTEDTAVEIDDVLEGVEEAA